MIDHYIQAEDSVKISPFDDISLLNLIELNLDKALENLPKSIRGNKEAVAETIENNVRSKIVEKHLLDPLFYDKMSALLLDLIAKRKKDSIKYENYLQELVALVTQVNNGGNAEDFPEKINTTGKKAIYNYLQNEELALVCDQAVQYAKKEDFRNNIQKQNEIKQAIYNVVQDEEKTLQIYSIIENNSEDY